jgi:tetratricopeptide (TPR) repeat protein
MSKVFPVVSVLVLVVFAAHGSEMVLPVDADADKGYLLYDDPVMVADNPDLAALAPEARGRAGGAGVGEALRNLATRRINHAWLPVYHLSYAPETLLFGVDARATQLASVLWLLLCALAAHQALRRCGFSPTVALVAAAVLAAHPLACESVAWASGRKDLVSLAFGLWALTAAVAGAERGGWRWPLAAALLAGLAILAKGSLLVLPALLLLALTRPRTDGVSLLGRSRSRSVLALLAVGVPVGAGTCAHLIVALEEGAAGGPSYYTRTQALPVFGEALAGYARQLVAPLWLSVHHDLGAPGSLELASLVGGVLLLAGLWACFLAVRGRGGSLAFGGAWLLLSLLPFNGVLPRTSVAMADRYLIVGLLGFGILVAGALVRFVPARPRLALVAVLLVALVALGRARTADFRDDGPLWTATLAIAPEDTLAPTMLADAYERLPDAEATHRAEILRLRLLAVSNAWHPIQKVRALQALAQWLLRSGDTKGAMERYAELEATVQESALDWEALDLETAAITHNRGAAQLESGEREAARASFEAALRADPELFAPRSALARLELQDALAVLRAGGGEAARQRCEDALAALETLLEANLERPSSRERDREDILLLRTLANGYLAAGDAVPNALLRAHSHAEFAVHRHPEQRAAQLLYARVVQATQGDPEPFLRAQLEQAPRDGAVLLELARVLHGKQKHREALRTLGRVPPESPAAEAAKGLSASIYSGQAHSWHAKGQLAKAVIAAREAIRYAPDRPEAHVDLGGYLLEAQQWSEAEAAYRRAYDLAPRLPGARRGLARCCTARALGLQRDRARQLAAAPEAERPALAQRIDDAVMEAFREAIRLVGRSRDADVARWYVRTNGPRRPQRRAAREHLNLAREAEKAGDTTGAIASLEDAVAVDGTYAEAWFRLGMLRHAAGRKKALEAMEAGLGFEPDDPRALYFHAQMSAAERRFEEALRSGRRFLEVAPAGATWEQEVSRMKAELPGWEAAAGR